MSTTINKISPAQLLGVTPSEEISKIFAKEAKPEASAWTPNLDNLSLTRNKPEPTEFVKNEDGTRTPVEGVEVPAEVIPTPVVVEDVEPVEVIPVVEETTPEVVIPTEVTPEEVIPETTPEVVIPTEVTPEEVIPETTPEEVTPIEVGDEAFERAYAFGDISSLPEEKRQEFVTWATARDKNTTDSRVSDVEHQLEALGMTYDADDYDNIIAGGEDAVKQVKSREARLVASAVLIAQRLLVPVMSRQFNELATAIDPIMRERQTTTQTYYEQEFFKNNPTLSKPLETSVGSINLPSIARETAKELAKTSKATTVEAFFKEVSEGTTSKLKALGIDISKPQAAAVVEPVPAEITPVEPLAPKPIAENKPLAAKPVVRMATPGATSQNSTQAPEVGPSDKSGSLALMARQRGARGIKVGR